MKSKGSEDDEEAPAASTSSSPVDDKSSNKTTNESTSSSANQDPAGNKEEEVISWENISLPCLQQSIKGQLQKLYFQWYFTPKHWKRRILASIALLIVAFTPVMVSRRFKAENMDIVVVWDPDDLIGCETDRYNETFAAFMSAMESLHVQRDRCEPNLVCAAINALQSMVTCWLSQSSFEYCSFINVGSSREMRL